MRRILLFIIICSGIFSSCKKDSNPVGPVSPSGNAPSTPLLLSPESNSVAEFIPVKFEWNADTGASSYILQISEHNDFSDFALNQDSIITTNQVVNSLDPLTLFYWRVRAANQHGQSDWSAPIRYFTTASAGNTGTPCPGIPTITYSGRIYHTVQIGSQCWLKENLDIGTMIPGDQTQTNNSVIEKYCYSNDTTICKIYGGLYNWDEAMQYAASGINVQGICPAGWHIPNAIEFNNLKVAVNNNGNSIKAIGQGSGSGAGTDVIGFSALLSGYRGQEGTFYDIGDYTNYWSSTENDTLDAGIMWLGHVENSVNQNSTDKTVGFSVRCLKN